MLGIPFLFSFRAWKPLFVGIIFSALPTLAHTERIYRHVGEDGTVSYSSEQPLPGLAPVELPKIEKKEMRPSQAFIQSCRAHGGTNCQAGADSDGSVICFDGYRKSLAQYDEHCGGTRIQVTEIRRRPSDGAFLVTLRNSRSVAAEKVKIIWKNDTEELPLLGASTLPAFGVEDYVLLFDHLPARLRPREIKKEDMRVHCDNCQWRSEELEIESASEKLEETKQEEDLTHSKEEP